jgi:2-polyprenyl-3-methyl-5-hydroxy-6-metoxy-1,4-benzoquinol methylase
MSEQPWYVEFFGEDYLRIYEPILTPERTAQEIAFIVERLGLAPGSKILDLCCGHGRHSIPLAGLGYQVTGQDLSQVFLDKAKATAAEAGVQVRWVCSDMRQIPFEAEFDAVINVFSAFAYLESQAEDQEVLQQVHKALKPDGLFLMEIMHRESLMRRFLPYGITRYEDGLIVLEERYFNLLTSRIEVRVTMIHPTGARTEYSYAMRIYTLTELAEMLEAAGLQLEACYGGLDGSELTLDSRRLALLARKPGA